MTMIITNKNRNMSRKFIIVSP